MTSLPRRLLPAALLAFAARSASAQRPIDLPPNAPADRPKSVSSNCLLDAMHQAMEPYVVQARASYRGFRYGQPYSFREADLVDWMVSRPDGSEEGNVVGNFLDSYTPPRTCT